MSEMPVLFFEFDGRSSDEYDLQQTQRLAVEVLYRCFKSEIVEFLPREWISEAGFRDVEQYIENLARVDRYRKSDDGIRSPEHELSMGLWLDPQIVCSQVGEAMVKRFFEEEQSLQDEKVILEFNEAICDLFDMKKVSWV